MRRRVFAGLLALALLVPLFGCGLAQKQEESSIGPLIPKPTRVVSLYASYTAAWLAAGGTLVGATEDAVQERGLAIGDAQLVGGLHQPSLEKIAALEPDLVIASMDVAGQLALKEQFAQMGIRAAYYSVNTFDDYIFMVNEFLSLTGRTDLRNGLVEAPRARVKAAWEACAAQRLADQEAGKAPPRVLLLRANSSGVSAKAEGTVAAEILADLGAVNIAAEVPSLLETLSLEVILEQDPAFIFVVPMGLEDADVPGLIEALKAENAAWRSLTGQWIPLPKELFHYKPNERWGESYARLAKILYP
jgi:iron complex transport system substrate-binding protein